MITKLDTARKGMVYGCMTTDEQQFLMDAQSAGATLSFYHTHKDWRDCKPFWDPAAAYWTDWTRPETVKFNGEEITVEEAKLRLERDYERVKISEISGPSCVGCPMLCKSPFISCTVSESNPLYCGDKKIWRKKQPVITQPANLPDGWKAYRVEWSALGGFYRLEDSSLTWSVRDSGIGTVNKGFILCKWLCGNEWYHGRMDTPCNEYGFADWAIFRPIEVKK